MTVVPETEREKNPVGSSGAAVKIIRAFKTELDLNNKQKTTCLQHAGAARFAYNWGLVRKKAAFAKGKKPRLPSIYTGS